MGVNCGGRLIFISLEIDGFTLPEGDDFETRNLSRLQRDCQPSTTCPAIAGNFYSDVFSLSK